MPLMWKKLLLCALLSGTALARDWYAPLHNGKPYVNPDLSVARVVREKRPRWDGQLVLWSGRLRKVRSRGQGWTMALDTPEGTIPVRCPRPVLTLKPDPREGCMVAIKGNLNCPGGRLTELVGRSIILLRPARSQPARTTQELLNAWVAFHCPDEKPEYAAAVSASIVSEAGRNRLDPLLLASLLQIESAFRKDAVSSSGAIGLGQLMPFTAAGLAVDPWQPDQNVAGAARMLAGLLQGWDSSLDSRALALASYNAGPTLVRSLQTVPAIPETNNYVYFIGFLHRHLSRLARTAAL